MNRLAVALLALALPACSIINKPCVDPCPPGSSCIAGMCVVIAPPPVEPPVDPPPVEPPVEPPPVDPPVDPPPVEPPPVDPPPTQPPVVTFPVRFPLPSAVIYMRNHRYGNGMDATPRVQGDPELCRAIHNVAVNDCHFDNDQGLWQYPEQRADYEGWVLAGARAGAVAPARKLGPIWEYKAGGQQRQCNQREDDVNNTSCDHFGSAASGWRDDPKTPEFEGRPAWLGEQRDQFGPYAGWFMVPQTSGPTVGTLIRACLPNKLGEDATCAPWVAVDWK